MASRITDHTIRVRALEKELEIGRQIQSCFLPDSLPEINDWHIDAYFKAAREVAGGFLWRISKIMDEVQHNITRDGGNVLIMIRSGAINKV